MRPRPGVRMGACESSPRRRPGLLVHDPVPVLAGVKVLPPPGRFTLTPAAAGELSRYGKPNKPRLRAGRALLRLLTEPDPMGAQMACRRVGRVRCLRIRGGRRDAQRS